VGRGPGSREKGEGEFPTPSRSPPRPVQHARPRAIQVAGSPQIRLGGGGLAALVFLVSLVLFLFFPFHVAYLVL
jgi:hypothetical protein